MSESSTWLRRLTADHADDADSLRSISCNSCPGTSEIYFVRFRVSSWFSLFIKKGHQARKVCSLEERPAGPFESLVRVGIQKTGTTKSHKVTRSHTKPHESNLRCAGA